MDIYEAAHKFRFCDTTNKLYRIKGGKECATIRKRGKLSYIQTTVGYKSFLAHRIIFLKVNGYLPDVIDHIDGNGLNNAPSNLRDGTGSTNGMNRRISDKSTTGVTGVLYRNNRGDYQVTIAGKYIGWSKNLFDAVCIRKSAELKANWKSRGIN